MNPIEVAKLNVAQRLSSGAPSAVAPTEASKAVAKDGQRASAAGVANGVSRVSAGEAPVDGSRVQEIRQAIEKGEYPLFPVEIADAMIAAGYLLRVKK